jgi:hypothetical protein
MYGGSLFFSSAASDTLQGKAIQTMNTRWGSDYRQWMGRETIGIPVCKKKYSPFDIQVKKIHSSGQVQIVVERMYGCACHSIQRKQLIEQHGERKGWEPFGQWSLKKAMTLAKKKLDTLFKTRGGEMHGVRKVDELEDIAESEEEEEDETIESWKSLCHNGKCAWKMKSKYDDVTQEDENEGIIVSSQKI